MNDDNTEIMLTDEQRTALEEVVRVFPDTDGSGEATQPETEVFIGEDPSDHVAE